jgi:hypothetical protein
MGCPAKYTVIPNTYTRTEVVIRPRSGWLKAESVKARAALPQPRHRPSNMSRARSACGVRAQQPSPHRARPLQDLCWMPMQTIRACRPFLTARSFRRRPPSDPLLLHLESRILSRLPSRCSVNLPSYRNFSRSSTRRVQYSRFDDDPNRPSQFSESSRLKTRDVVIYTVATGAIVYYFVQCVTIHFTFTMVA